MGGFGSGRRPNDPRRPLAEEARPLRIGRLLAQLRTPGATTRYQWRSTSGTDSVLIEIAVDRRSVLLVAGAGSEMRTQRIVIVTGPLCERRFWACPGCRRRAKVLFSPAGGSHWACGRCAGVVYRSNGGNAPTRALARAALAGAPLQVGGAAMTALDAAWLVERRMRRSR